MSLAKAPYSSGMTVLAIAGATATQTSNSITGMDAFTAAKWHVDITAITGTSPTMDIYIQNLAADGSTWYDIAAFAQITATGDYTLEHVSSGNSTFTMTDGTMTASTIKNVPFGPTFRVKAKLGGTNPTCTGTVYLRAVE